ncbi:MAG: type II toxin-antitoxin system VapC family toxin [Microvirga sp.]
MFLDASAVMAILLQEEGFEVLLSRIQASTTSLKTSPFAYVETVLNFASRTKTTIDVAMDVVAEFNGTLGVENVTITPEIGVAATRLYARYGKGHGHPARLNLGDCFAAAVANHLRMPLLSKGSDFARTDFA